MQLLFSFLNRRPDKRLHATCLLLFLMLHISGCHTSVFVKTSFEKSFEKYRRKSLKIQKESKEALELLLKKFPKDYLLKKTGHPNWRTRCAAVDAVSVYRDNETVDKLIEIMRNDNDDRVVRTAVNALGRLKNRRALKPLIDIFMNVSSYPGLRTFSCALRQFDRRWLAAMPSQVKEKLLYAVVKVTPELITLEDLPQLCRFLENLDLKNSSRIPHVYRNAAEILGRLQDPRAIGPLLTVLEKTGKEHDDLRRDIIDALDEIHRPGISVPLIRVVTRLEGPFDRADKVIGSLKEPEAFPYLLEALDHKRKEVRHMAISALARFGDKRAVKALLPLLKDPDKKIKINALEAIDKLKAPGAVRRLGEMIEDEDTDIREAAILALMNAGNPAADKLLLTLLKKGDQTIGKEIGCYRWQLSGDSMDMVDRALREEGHGYMKEIMVKVLAASTDPACKKYLITLLDSKDDFLRFSAFEQISLDKHPSLKERFTTALDDPYKPVRFLAACPLGFRGVPRAIDYLLKLLEEAMERVAPAAHDVTKGYSSQEESSQENKLSTHSSTEDIDSFHRIVFALSQNKTDDVIRSLIKAYGKSDPEHKYEIAEALGELEAQEAAAVLIRDLTAPEKWLKCAIVRALGKIGAKAAVGPLTSLLKSPHMEVRRRTVRSLRMIGDKRAGPPILAYLRTRIAAEPEFDKYDGPSCTTPYDDIHEMFMTLAVFGEDRAIPLILKIFWAKKTNRLLKSYLENCFTGFSSDRSAAYLLKELKRRDSKMRGDIFGMLGLVNNKNIYDILISFLDHPYKYFRLKVGFALDHFFSSKYFETHSEEFREKEFMKFAPLLIALRYDFYRMREKTAWFMIHLKDAKLINLYLPAFKDETRHVRESAAWAAGKIGAVRAVPLLIEALSDHRYVREQAIYALGQLEAQEAVEHITPFLKHRDISLRDAAADALKKIAAAKKNE